MFWDNVRKINISIYCVDSYLWWNGTDFELCRIGENPILIWYGLQKSRKKQVCYVTLLIFGSVWWVGERRTHCVTSSYDASMRAASFPITNAAADCREDGKKDPSLTIASTICGRWSRCEISNRVWLWVFEMACLNEWNVVGFGGDGSWRCSGKVAVYWTMVLLI